MHAGCHTQREVFDLRNLFHQRSTQAAKHQRVIATEPHSSRRNELRSAMRRLMTSVNMWRFGNIEQGNTRLFDRAQCRNDNDWNCNECGLTGWAGFACFAG